MRTLTLNGESWPLVGWTPAKEAAVAKFVQLRHLSQKRPEDQAFARVKALPEHLQTIAFGRLLDRLDTPLPSLEEATKILAEVATVQYLAAAICPECPAEKITAANALEAYMQLIPTPMTEEEKEATYAWMQSLVTQAMGGVNG